MGHRIKVQYNRKYDFTVEDTKRILDEYIIPYFTDITYVITESKSTNSIYVYLKKGDVSVPVRLSDHPTPKNLRFYNITEKTKTKHLVAIFVKNAKRLSTKNTLTLLSQLKEDKC